MIKKLLKIIWEADEVIRNHEIRYPKEKEAALKETAHDLSEIDILLSKHFEKT